jgi:hypothetical protein
MLSENRGRIGQDGRNRRPHETKAFTYCVSRAVSCRSFGAELAEVSAGPKLRSVASVQALIFEFLTSVF